MSFFTAVLNGFRRPALPEPADHVFDLDSRHDGDGSRPGKLSQREPEGVRRPRPGAPIFIQSMWRASSTYVWKKFRDQPQYRAYCEPLHEILSLPREHVERANGPDVWKRLRHPVTGAFYFGEFPFAANGGVENFQKPFSFERYCLDETEPDEPLRRYIAHLIDSATTQGQRAVLQFNRGLLRAGWLSRQFRPIQILLLRRPLHLWKSFLSYPGHSFSTYIAMIFGQNREKAPLRFLPAWLDFPRLVRPAVSQEWKLYQAFTAANESLLYPSFFDLTVLGAVHCAQSADCILDLDEITRNPAVRQAATDRLRELGIAIDLEDCAVPDYEAEPADREWLAYEEFSRGFLPRALPAEISISEARMRVHEPLLGPYFRELLSGFVGRRPETPANAATEKSAEAVRLFAGRQFEPAARLLGQALAVQPTSTRWNDWAVTQTACSRPRLAALGFRQALRLTPVDREAAGNLGALLLSQGKSREALPLLERAELEVEQPTRPVITNLVNKARQTLGLSVPEKKTAMLDILGAQAEALQQISAALVGLDQRVRELSAIVSRQCAAPVPASAPAAEIQAASPKPRRKRPSGKRTLRRASRAPAARRNARQASRKKRSAK